MLRVKLLEQPFLMARLKLQLATACIFPILIAGNSTRQHIHSCIKKWKICSAVISWRLSQYSDMFSDLAVHLWPEPYAASFYRSLHFQCYAAPCSTPLCSAVAGAMEPLTPLWARMHQKASQQCKKQKCFLIITQCKGKKGKDVDLYSASSCTRHL